MDTQSAFEIAEQALLLVLALSAPAVLTALVVGLLVSVLQAATQIQEQTLAAAFKIVAVFMVVLMTGAMALAALVEFGTWMFESIAEIRG